MRSVISFLKKHPVLLLVLVVFVTAITAYHKYIFEGWAFLFDDIGSDTKQLYFMHYNSIVNHLRNGDFSFWDATNGFGTSMFQYTLFNPLLWIIYLVGLISGNAAMAGAIVWVVILAMILSGIAAWHFLSCFELSVKAKFVAAYIYSFNGFLTLWGQHFAFLAIMVYMPFVLMLIERAMKKRRFSPALAFCVGLTALCTYYFTYMLVMVVALYAILRLWTLRVGNVKTYFCVLFKQAGAVILGVGIGMLNILPNIGIVFGVSSRTESSTGIIERIMQNMTPWPKAYYETLADKFLSSGLQGNSSVQPYTGFANYYESPNVFFTSLFLIMLVQFIIFIIIRKWDIRKKTASVIGIAIGAFSILIPAGSLPFNFFAYAFSRHTFLLMPFFALLTAFMLDKLIKERFLNIPAVIVTVLGCIFVCYKAYTKALVLTVALTSLGTCILTIALGVFLVIYRKTSGKWAVLSYSLIALTVIGQVWVNLYSTVYSRETVRMDDESYTELYGDDYNELSKWLAENDNDEYRVERDFYSFSYCMDNLALGFDGVSTYNSTMDSDLIDFIEKIAPDMIYEDQNHILFTNIALNRQFHELFGIKYIISKSDEPPYENYELVRTFGELYLYKNTQWRGFATFYTNAVSESEYERLTSSDEKIDIPALLSQVLILDDDNLDAMIDAEESSNAVIDMKNVGSDGFYKAKVMADEDGYLLMPIPYGDGWSVTIDGDATTDIAADYGFSAVKLTAGEHIVEYRYTQPYLYEGFAATCVSLGAWAVIICLQKRRNKQANS